MKSILDPSFKYTPADDTDIRQLFARWRKEQKLPPLLKVVKDKPSPLRISGNLKRK